MNILITGSGGYLGARLTEYLSSRHVVRIISSPSSFELHKSLGTLTTLVDADWSNSDGLHNATKGIDTIIHAYGLNSFACGISATDALTFNAIHTANLLEAAINNNVKKFVYLSTAHVYGDLEGHKCEKDLLNPIHPYGFSKRAGEDVVRFLANKSNTINYRILRLANVIGPPIFGNKTCWNLLVNDLCRQAIYSSCLLLRSNGMQSRNFLTMQDFLRAVDYFTEESSNNGIYNLGSEKSIKVIEMANLIASRFASIYGCRMDIYKNEDDKSDYGSTYYDCSKLKQENFHFMNNFEEEIDATLRFLALEKGLAS
jgi:UDP-glucose 4-epimerase